MPARYDIALQRNEDYSARWTITDDADQPIDLAGHTLTMQVKERLEAEDVLASADIDVVVPASGQADIVLLASGGSPLALYGDPLQTYELPFDLILTDPEGINRALVAGYVCLSRGVSAP